MTLGFDPEGRIALELVQIVASETRSFPFVL